MKALILALCTYFSPPVPVMVQQPIPVHPKPKLNVIMDLGGVVFDTCKWTATKEIGLSTLARYVIARRKSPRDLVFNYLESLNPKTSTDIVATDEHGKPMSKYHSEYLKGTIDACELRSIIGQSLSANTAINSIDRSMILAMTTMMFTPTTFIKTQKLYQEAVRFIDECIADGHDVYVLSNWDPASFDLIEKQHPELFKKFKGMIVSGRVHQTKPDRPIYRTLLSHFNLDPKTCVFIDDITINIEAGKKLGIDGIIRRPGDFSQVRKEFAAIVHEKSRPLLVASLDSITA